LLRRRGRVSIDDEVRGGDGPTKHRRFYRVARELSTDEDREWRRKRPAQYAVYTYLHTHPLRRAQVLELNATFPNAAAKLRGLVEVTEEEVYRSVLPDTVVADRPVQLTAAQRAAVQAVRESLGTFRSFLLWGVTGSGKTEVYLHAIAACLAAQRTALVLVPEI